MNTQLVHLDPIRVVMLRHRGSYDKVGPVFDQLAEWASRHGVSVPRYIGIYWDNPDYTPGFLQRSAACFEVAPTFVLPPTDGLHLEINAIAGGTYVTTRFQGPYEALAPVWSQFTDIIQNGRGLQISRNPAFEIYENDPSDTPPDQLVTDLYMPVN